MKKIKALSTFRWTVNLPVFNKDEIYRVEDKMGKEMVKHGYAVFMANYEVDNEFEDKMVDTSKRKRGRPSKKIENNIIENLLSEIGEK